MDKTDIYFGNIYWLFEGLKVTNIETKDITKASGSSSTFNFFECIIFHKEKEHSLFYTNDNTLYEYFSDDRCELILKLLKIYVLKYSKSFNILNEKNQNPKYKQSKEIYMSVLQKKIISSKVKANIFLKYENGKTKWIEDYEVKRLLFNFKFLHDYTKIEMIRLFPLNVTEGYITQNNKIYTFIDAEDKFDDNITEQVNYPFKTDLDAKYLNFTVYAKNMFYTKYGLNLKKLDIEGIDIDGIMYIMDVKEMKFEKFDTKYIHLKSERLLRNFQNNYKYHNLNIQKQTPNIQDFKQLFNTMLSTYENVLDKYKVKDFLTIPPKDKTSDNVISLLKPKMNLPFSYYLEEKVPIQDFAKNCSNKLYNNY